MFTWLKSRTKKIIYSTVYSALKDYQNEVVNEMIKGYQNEQNQTNIYSNLELKLQMNALDSTAKYIEQNMYNTPSYDTHCSLLNHAISIAKKPGLLCEFGVYGGRTINYIAKQVNTVVHGFDSFEGLPEYWRDGFGKGTFALTDKTQLPHVLENVRLHVGWFDKTLPVFIEQNPEDISFMHIDCDLYSSTQTIFQVLKARIKSGTVIIFDEYFNYPFWQRHEFKAFQEFIIEANLKYEYVCYHKYNQQVVVKIL